MLLPGIDMYFSPFFLIFPGLFLPPRCNCFKNPIPFPIFKSVRYFYRFIGKCTLRLMPRGQSQCQDLVNINNGSLIFLDCDLQMSLTVTIRKSWPPTIPAGSLQPPRPNRQKRGFKWSKWWKWLTLRWKRLILLLSKNIYQITWPIQPTVTSSLPLSFSVFFRKIK